MHSLSAHPVNRVHPVQTLSARESERTRIHHSPNDSRADQFPLRPSEDSPAQLPILDSRFSILNSSASSPFAQSEGLPPENASARHHTAEAFSLPENSTEPNDGNALCPEKVQNKNNNGAAPEAAPSSSQLRITNSQFSILNPSAPHVTQNPKSQIPDPKLKSHQLHAGARRLAVITRALELRAAGQTWDTVSLAVNQPVGTLYRWIKNAFENLGTRLGLSHPQLPITNSQFSILNSSPSSLTAADCSPQNHKAGRPPKFKPLPPETVAAVKSIELGINRNYRAASAPEAIRRSAAAGLLPPDLVEALALREQSGQPMLTDSLRAQIALTETEVRAYRSPNEANLDYVQSPGSLMLTRDAITGEERFYRPGEAFTIDDGSINLGCCVALERPGDKCWEKFGVIVGRFQFIPVVDHRTRCLLGFSYTARPRDSYRAEDLTATMQTIFAAHGIPREMHLEYGTSDSRLVNETLRRAGVEPKHVNSPHQKVIESLFNLLWTKLSSLPGQIGRFRGEMEEEGRLLSACKQGHQDPRRHFPSLPDVLAAMRHAIAELNAQWVNSPQYGRWQPAAWFARDAHKTTRPLAPQDAWIFSPVITRPLIVRGFCVQTSVPLMPGFSLKFHFGADFFAEFHGDEVILHFNPFAPDCEAMVIHARSGKVLGPAQQINRHARFTRRAFGYGADPDIGHIAARKHAQALHRTMVAVKVGSSARAASGGSAGASGPSGQIAYATAEQRDGLGNLIRAEVGSRSSSVLSAPSVVKKPETPAPTIDPAELSARRATRARRVQIATQLREDA